MLSDKLITCLNELKNVRKPEDEIRTKNFIALLTSQLNFFTTCSDNFIQVLKEMRNWWAIYRSDLRRLHSTFHIVIALMSKEIHDGS